jgi:protein-S-isoprenylcysteine O-methyltransferase Ste14
MTLERSDDLAACGDVVSYSDRAPSTSSAAEPGEALCAFRIVGQSVISGSSNREYVDAATGRRVNMRNVTYRIAMNTVIGGAFGRALVVSALAVRTFAKRRDFTLLRMGPVERFIAPEPAILGATTAWVLRRKTRWEKPSGVDALASCAGAALTIGGLVLALWSWRSWRAIFFGHGLVEGQELVTSGAYGFIRHPAYAGALLTWLGLAVGSRSLAATFIALGYVTPGYLLYLRAEEKMMTEAYGEEYALYRKAVPMLIPRLPRRSEAAGQKDTDALRP